MNCQRAEHWLLSANDQDPLPTAIQQHLESCLRCRQMRQQLLQIDLEVRQLPAAPPNCAARRRLDDLLKRSPGPEAPPRSPFRRVWRVVVPVAACLLLATGWHLGRQSPVPQRANSVAARPTKKTGVPSKKPADEMALVLRVVGHDVRLSESTQADEKLDRLVMIAGDLKDEALLLLRNGNTEDLPQLVELYQHVLRHGIARRAYSLPREAKDKVVPGLLRKLWKTDAELSNFSRYAPPLAAELLRPMRDVTRETVEQVRSGRKPARPGQPLPEVRDTSSLLAALVLNGLKLSEEGDPLQRADLCAELANRVVPSVVLLSSGGDAQEAGDLVESLAALLNRGVVGNLDQADPATRVAEMQKVRARLLQVLAILDENLANAPPAAKAGLQNAMRAANYAPRTAPKLKSG